MVLVLTGLSLSVACQSGSKAGKMQSERARDSVIGQSRLPGAGGVRGALRASDSAGSRRALEDSIAGTP
jgi:hypothetical protein